MAYFILEVNMRIYENEIKDNLKQAMEESNSIAFVCDILDIKRQECPVCKSLTEIHEDEKSKAFADINEKENKQPDLYYLNSVLVSAGWNKNDDVFSTQALWAARNTPVDKQFNLMHDESDIIGHITNALVMDQDGNILENEPEEDLPEKFDIITSAVIYKT